MIGHFISIQSGNYKAARSCMIWREYKWKLISEKEILRDLSLLENF